MKQKTKKALVVDDDKSTLLIIARALENMGVTTILASNPRTALQIVSDNSPFDVIITDYQMPEMNGAELIQSINANHPDSHRSVIMTSGVISLPQINQLLSGGVDYFLPKPLNLREMCRYLNKVLAPPRDEVSEAPERASEASY